MSSQVWDVKMPAPKKQMFQGRLVPTVKGSAFRFVTKKRKITLEVHGKPGVSPIDHTLMNQIQQGKLKASAKLGDKDLVIIRIMKEKDDRDYPDDESVMTQGDGTVSTLGEGGGLEDTHVEHQRFRLENVHILRIHGKYCEVKVGHGNDTVVRDLKFKSTALAERFKLFVERLQIMEKDRANEQAQKYLSKHSKRAHDGSSGIQTRDLFAIEEGTNGEATAINILVEIVSAKGLPAADLLSSDPYVVVRMGGVEIHRTSVISKSLNPIWTLKTGSLFLIQKTPEQFFSCTSGCIFAIKDYDAVGSNEALGTVTVPLEDILDGKGERKEYLVEPEKSNMKQEGKLYLRFKPATDDEIEFMKRFQSKPKEKGLFIEETYLRPGLHKEETGPLKRQVKRGTEKEELHRAKPCPDPSRPKYETEWMTVKNLRQEALKPSTQWVEAGSGELGKLFVEIIGCDDLPNMDKATLNPMDKTDAFACLVFEDCAINTDVIENEISPRWMPWSRRAFAFNVSHLSSSLYLGLFDYDPEMSPMQMLSKATGALHDPIARCVVSVSQCTPGTVYTTSYALYYGETTKDRKKTRGKIILRLRLELNSMTMSMIKSMIPPEMSFVSTNRGIDFDLIHYTAEGSHDFNKWSMDTFMQHIEELQSYEILVDYVLDGLMTVWLWRGHYPVNFCGKRVLLPFHSMTAFAWAIIISWDFNTFFSFLVFSIGWVLLACNEFTGRSPSPWYQTSSYFSMLGRLVFNTSIPETIDRNQSQKEYEEFLKGEAERKELKKKRKEIEQKFVSQVEEELGDEMAEAATEVDEDLTTSKQGPLKGIGLSSVNPMKPILYPIQLELGKVVLMLRGVKNIVLWRQSYYAFWATTGCFLASLSICWLPWGWMLRWVIRIAAIGLLGPWMMLVDHFVFREKPDLTPEQREAEMIESIRARYAYLEEAATTRQLQKERRKKLKAMKQYLYGKFIQKVPHFIEDEFIDFPLIESTAERYDPKKHGGEPYIVDRKYGQALTGDMIPKREIQASHVSEKSSKRKKRGLVGRVFRRGRFRRGGDKDTNESEDKPLLENSDTDKYESVESFHVVGLA